LLHEGAHGVAEDFVVFGEDSAGHILTSLSVGVLRSPAWRAPTGPRVRRRSPGTRRYEGDPLPSLEFRLALLEERTHAFGAVLTLAQPALQRRLDVEGARPVARHGVAHRLLGGGERERGPLRQRTCPFQRVFHQ